MRILGIETSCDETSAAVVDTDGRYFSVLSNIVSSQIKIHQKYGGVVPEVAARNHVGRILPVIQKALPDANSQFPISSFQFPDRIAVTVGPGLLTSLLVGIETAKVLAYTWGVPIVGVNHMAGHTYSALLPPEQRNTKLKTLNSKQIQNLKLKSQNPGLGFRISPASPDSGRVEAGDLEFPAIALLVSGGHTELVLMRKHGVFQVIGQTIDDAAGEAFDKVAKMLDLGYPGGPAIDRLAAQGNPNAVKFPRAMLGKESLDFSFSGLKTSVMYYTKERKNRRTEEHIENICASVQQAIVDVLVKKTIMAAKKYKVKTVMLGGGVSANRQLRRDLGVALVRELSRVRYFIPALEYTTDNAAMIAAAGYFEKEAHWSQLAVAPNLTL